MTLPIITPGEAQRRLAEGSAILIDIREPMEHAREAIPAARLSSLSTLAAGSLSAASGESGPAIIFHCQSGRRTAENAARLKACGAPQAFILEGGLSGWKAAGLPTRIDRAKPIELQRQVQIAAGTLVLLGLLLAWLAAPQFILLSAFVGAGLVFAGISGWCGMARLLGAMPWNRAA